MNAVKRETAIHFGSFRVDTQNEQLWRDGCLIPLKTKGFTVLHYLLENPGLLVTKEELLEAVWP